MTTPHTSDYRKREREGEREREKEGEGERARERGRGREGARERRRNCKCNQVFVNRPFSASSGAFFGVHDPPRVCQTVLV